jgi:hypothetical protein
MGLVPRGAEHGSPRGQARITSPNIGSDKSFVDDLNQERAGVAGPEPWNESDRAEALWKMAPERVTVP